jgi:hypothetical protein
MLFNIKIQFTYIATKISITIINEDVKKNHRQEADF